MLTFIHELTVGKNEKQTSSMVYKSLFIFYTLIKTSQLNSYQFKLWIIIDNMERFNVQNNLKQLKIIGYKKLPAYK